MSDAVVETYEYQGKVYKIASGQLYEQLGQGWMKRGISVHLIRKRGTLLKRTQVESAPPCVLGPPCASGPNDPTRTRGPPD